MTINREIIPATKLKQIRAYIDTLRNAKQIQMMFNFSFYCGMRCINFTYLQIKDVIKDNGEIRDFIELGGYKNKGDKLAKYYLNDRMKLEIEKYISKMNLTDGERFLFTSQKTGKPYNRNSISKIFTSIYKTFNLNCSTHYGRRNFITTLLTNGTDITTVKTLVNHSNIQTTTLYYNENPEVLLEAVNQI